MEYAKLLAAQEAKYGMVLLALVIFSLIGTEPSVFFVLTVKDGM